MSTTNKLTWTITLTVDPLLVVDGFDAANQIRPDEPDAGGQLSQLGRIVDHWRPEHCEVRITHAPTPETIAAVIATANEEECPQCGGCGFADSEDAWSCETCDGCGRVAASVM